MALEFIDFLKKMTPEEKDQYLFDVLDRYSTLEDVLYDEVVHAGNIKRSICAIFTQHCENRTISHEMRAIAVLCSQFNRMADANAKFPLDMLELSDDPAFVMALLNVRNSQRAQHPDFALKRA